MNALRVRWGKVGNVYFEDISYSMWRNANSVEITVNIPGHGRRAIMKYHAL